MQNRRLSKGAHCFLSHYVIIDLHEVQISISGANKRDLLKWPTTS